MLLSQGRVRALGQGEINRPPGALPSATGERPVEP